MFKKILQNTRKPQGFLGRIMLKGMNSGHTQLSEWGFSYLNLKGKLHILDVGCGGGANLAKMLRDLPESIADGIDYSEESVAFSKKTNSAHLGKRCTIRQGNVLSLPYSDHSLDVVTAFETIYFWPSLDKAFEEIKRVLKANGVFLICCESDDAEDTTWTSRIDGMTVYQGEDLKNRLLKIGFQNIELHMHKKGWICLKAVC